MKRCVQKIVLSLLLGVAATSLIIFSSAIAKAGEGDSEKLGYAIVATPSVIDDADWSKVVDSLKERRSSEYDVSVIKWDDSALEELRKVTPRYICFVTKPEDASIEQLASVWKMTREIDDDPYGDAIWGIITGFDANDALRLTQTEDMVVERAVAGTSIALDYFKSGVVFDETKKNHWVVKKEGEDAEDRNDAPDDTTKAIADELDNAQLFVTSGHASERNWSIGYAYKNGFFVAQQGELLGVPSNDKPFKIEAKGSKIHLASGNCLLGHIDKPDCLALSMIRNANVDTLVGYVVPTWFGYMGWGVMDYYIEQPGRFTVAEAFFANNQALLNVLEDDNNAPESERLDAQTRSGMEFDRDVVVLYGDPAWSNALAVQDSGWKQELTSEKVDDGSTVWTLTITPLKGDKSYELVDTNGSQRSGRPFFQFFPKDVSDAEVIEGNEFAPVVTENFILISSKQKLPTDNPIVIKIATQ
ncbi:MAG: hypothetical protein ACOX0A_03420 [Thermoguttaceae bacterium]|jgi:hypothetical protein